MASKNPLLGFPFLEKTICFNVNPGLINHGLLRKPASWIVAVCERSEYKGVWGQGLPTGTVLRRLPAEEGVQIVRFSLLCTRWQFCDVWARFPPGPALGGV